MIARRTVMAAGLAMPWVARAAGPLRIGVLTDLSAWGQASAGPGSVQAARMAVAEAGGTAELVVGDHQMKVDVGLSLARRWFDEGVQAIVDVPNSAIGIGVHNLARERNRVALLSGSVSSDITNQLCSPNTVQFSLDTYGASRAAVKTMSAEGARSWFFIVADFAFGHAMQADAERFVAADGGKVLGSLRHPPGTTDFSSYLLAAQSSGADVIALANSAADTTNAIKQASEFGILTSRQRIAALFLFITDVHGVGLAAAQGIRATTTSYWNQDTVARAWSQRFFATVGAMPTMTQAGTYSAVTHYLKATAAAGTYDPARVLAQMRALPVEDAFIHAGQVRADGRVIQDALLVRVKTPADSREPWDYYDVTARLNGPEVFRPVSESACALVKA